MWGIWPFTRQRSRSTRSSPVQVKKKKKKPKVKEKRETLVDVFLPLFSGGEIKRIIMGLDKVSHSPCGFCFVEFYDAADARRAEYLVSGGLILVDERAVKVDADLGFKEGRQFGRGLQGFQKRDERLQHSRDPGRPSLYRQSEQQSKPRSRSRERARGGGGGGGGDRDRGRDRDRDTRGRARRERSRSRSSGSDSDSEHGSRKRLRDADAEVPMLDDEPAVKAAKEEAEEEKH